MEPSSLPTKIINRIYYPNLSNQSPQEGLFEKLFGDSVVFYSYCRHALCSALSVAGIGKGDKVLMPSFICRDLLAAVHSVGAEVIFYSINKSMEADFNFPSLEKVKAAIAVNFFGFPCHIDRWKEFALKNDLLLIEDNAHGFLSGDSEERYLGTRGDVGVFSFRKTFPVFLGGGLLINNNSKIRNTVEKVEFLEDGQVSKAFKIKMTLRPVAYYLGGRFIQFITQAVRYLRKVRTGQYVPMGTEVSERQLPEEKKSVNLPHFFKSVSFDEEKQRRRDLYKLFDGLLKDQKIQPLFSELQKNVVPIGYPFLCQPEDIEEVSNYLNKVGAECYNWPDLPSAVKESDYPDWYENIWVVRFLW